MSRPSRLVAALFILILLHGTVGLAQDTSADKLVQKGLTVTLAQVVTWLDKEQFAVGRWDGTLSIFRPPLSGEYGPVLEQVLKLPTTRAIEMIKPIRSRAFVTSNGNNALALWTKSGSRYVLSETYSYDAKAGTANSAAVLTLSGKQWLVTGHSEGYIVIWSMDCSGLEMQKSISLRSSDPIPSPYQLWNVRSVVPWKDGLVVTGAEDGDLCLVRIPAGTVEARVRFNPKAQRGINDLAVLNNHLLLANCSVGSEDKNLWLYELKPGSITMVDSANLAKDTTLPQVFNFSVQVVPYNGTVFFLASTQEGLLWMGRIENNKIVPGTKVEIGCPGSGGAATAFQKDSRVLSVVARDIYLYEIVPRP